MRVTPFAALRPVDQEAACRIAAVPYDVVDRREAFALSRGNPDHFLHVTRPEIDLPEAVDGHDPAVYRQARCALEAMKGRGVLARDPFPRFYAYRQVMGEHSQTGLVACCAVKDYAGGIIRLHEKTRADKEDDRTRHTLRVMANTGPVFLMFRDRPAACACLEQVADMDPLYDFTASDGVRHTVWAFPAGRPTDDVRSAFAEVPVAYVADGHHRAAAAWRAGECLRRDKAPEGPEAPYDGFMAAMFPASSLQVFPYHRLVKHLNGMSPDQFLSRAGGIFNLTGPGAYSPPGGPGRVAMRVAGKWYGISWPPPAGEGPVEALDVAVLQSRLLAPVLGIEDPRTDERIEFIGGIRGIAELESRADQSPAVAFVMHPVGVGQVMDVADGGGIMPPKSTWFEPKLRSGLLVHELQG